jgi:hypothetical protein
MLRAVFNYAVNIKRKIYILLSYYNAYQRILKVFVLVHMISSR